MSKTYFNNHFTHKTLINFNDGTFGWSWLAMDNQTSIEKQKRQNVISNILHKIYGYNSEYSYYFYYVSHVVWILILTLGFFLYFQRIGIGYYSMHFISEYFYLLVYLNLCLGIYL